MEKKEKRKETDLLVFIKAKNLAEYILLISGRSPVKYRYSLLNNLIKSSLDVIELLYEANELQLKDERRLELIRKAKTKLKTIDFISAVATKAGCFTDQQQDVILTRIGDCSKYLLGYYNSCKNALAI